MSEQMSMLGGVEEEKKEKESKKAKPKKKVKKKKRVKVYGNELFVAAADATQEDIRQVIVNEYGYSELTKQVTAYQTVPIEENETEEFLLVSPSIPSHKKKG